MSEHDDTQEVQIELSGGPLDGEHLTYQRTDLEDDPAEWGAYLIVNGPKHHPEDPGARAIYEAEPGFAPRVWHFHGWA